jgi:hypothetical protein
MAQTLRFSTAKCCSTPPTPLNKMVIG